MCLSIRQTFFSLFPLVRDFCGRTPGRIFSSFFRFGDGHVCVRTIKVFPNTTIISVLVILIILSVFLISSSSCCRSFPRRRQRRRRRSFPPRYRRSSFFERAL